MMIAIIWVSKYLQLYFSWSSWPLTSPSCSSNCDATSMRLSCSLWDSTSLSWKRKWLLQSLKLTLMYPELCTCTYTCTCIQIRRPTTLIRLPGSQKKLFVLGHNNSELYTQLDNSIGTQWAVSQSYDMRLPMTQDISPVIPRMQCHCTDRIHDVLGQCMLLLSLFCVPNSPKLRTSVISRDAYPHIYNVMRTVSTLLNTCTRGNIAPIQFC